MKKLILLLAITLIGGVLLTTFFQKTDETQTECATEARTYFSEWEWGLHPKSSNTSLKLDTHFNKRINLCLLRVDRFSSHYGGISVYDVRHRGVQTVMDFTRGEYADGRPFVMCTLSNGNRCSNEKEAIADADKLMSE